MTQIQARRPGCMTAHASTRIQRAAAAIVFISAVNVGAAERPSEFSKYYERNRCGPIALCCILRHFDIGSTIDEVAELCGYRGQPITVAALVAAAEKKGLVAETYESSLRHLKRIGGPAIIDFPFGHFCVFLGWEDGKARIQDPPHPVRAVMPEELEKKWGRHLITFSIANKRRSRE